MTAHKVELKTVLVYGPLADPLLDDLRSTFDEVLYYPITPFAPRDESEALPSDDDYKRADVLFGFQIPFNLKDWKQTPRLKLFQGCSAGYGHVTDTDYFKSIPGDADVIFASASGIHVCVADLLGVVQRKKLIRSLLTRRSTIGEHVLGTVSRMLTTAFRHSADSLALQVLMLTHKLGYLNIALHNEQRWVPHKELGSQFIRDLNTLKVGIMGYGHIGASCRSLRRFLAHTQSTQAGRQLASSIRADPPSTPSLAAVRRRPSRATSSKEPAIQPALSPSNTSPRPLARPPSPSSQHATSSSTPFLTAPQLEVSWARRS